MGSQSGKCDEKDGKPGLVGYEIPFNRHFCEYAPPRPLDEIDAGLEMVSAEIMELPGGLKGVNRQQTLTIHPDVLQNLYTFE
ncbi:MAG: hypothetical protein JJU29_05100 [Verrucomicrobia bacterium]|nr:hypothetical protein [Verrucomicrobiota bacterium]MCH8511317.1 hypothetical protein [Kiritimatiellia bacterium]